MEGEPSVPEWPGWFRTLLLSLLAFIAVGLAVRAVIDATSPLEAARGLAAVGILCLWLAYRHWYVTRWRGRAPQRAGVAFLGCLAITGAVLVALGPADGQRLDGDLLFVFALAAAFGLALVISPLLSLSRRAFGVLIALTGLGIGGLAVVGPDPFDPLETLFVGAVCLLVGILYALRPDRMARFERDTER